MTSKSTCGPDVASWNNDKEIDAMSTALDFRTKLQIAILVVLFIVALLGEPAPKSAHRLCLRPRLARCLPCGLCLFRRA